ncbi:MAG: 3-hydroxyacyl-CoA dehydrogenase family protein [Actinomycetota bacterium]|nr:3-hydroxyacyl-CoA dehydrogenase family protein [Actinomycetota bacterium]
MTGRNVAVIGGGTMGIGIAYRFAVAGARVYLVDLDLEHAERSVGRLGDALARAVERGKLTTEDANAAGERLTPAGSVESVPMEPDFIIEAVIEDPDLKTTILRAAEARHPAVLASNTSSISIDELAAGLSNPERFAGMHFFNPVWAIHLVEVVRGTATSDETITRIAAGVAELGMETAIVNDVPGFASTRLGLALGLEAIRMVEEGVAEPADIDRAMELGYRHAMGPLRTGDLVGLDVRLAIAEHLWGVYGDRFEPPRLLREMVAEGKLGKKSGHGFYDWR